MARPAVRRDIIFYSTFRSLSRRLAIATPPSSHLLGREFIEAAYAMPCRRAARTRTDIAALSHSGHSQLQVITISSDLEFAALESSWSAIERTIVPCPAFLTYDWFGAAWAWRRLDATMSLQVVRNADEVVGIFPLIRKRDSARGLRCLEFLTVPDTQMVDLIAGVKDVDRVAESIASAMAQRHDWDVLQLDRLPPDGATMVRLAPAFLRHGLRVHEHDGGNNPFIALAGTWSSYYGTRSRRLKKANNNAVNRLRRAGEIRIEWVQPNSGDNAQVDRALETVIDISRRSWKRETGNSLDQPGPQAFIRSLSTSARRRGWLSMWVLSVNDTPLAMEYQIIDVGRIHALRADFDASCEEISPGSYLFRHLLEGSFGRGMTRYYMGPGENPYKMRWTDDAEPLKRITVYNRTMRGRLSWFQDVKLKPPLRSMRDRFVGWQQARRPAPVSHDDPIGA